ncbi:hypothetical protein GCM10022221_64390 [Actinocorallia aurea]
MSDFLTSDIDRADALIDLSNVVLERSLGGSGAGDLLRLERVGQALSALYGTSETRMYAVADESLLRRKHYADERQFRTLKRWRAEQVVHVAEDADPVLLELADRTGLPIITKDRFRNHREDFPWLDGSDDSILEPRAGARGEVLLCHVVVQPVLEYEVSRAAEGDLLKHKGVRARQDLLTRIWGCPEPRCPWHDPLRTGLLFVPRWNGDRLYCELHGRDVVDLGPRPETAQVKVISNGAEVARFSVRAGQRVPVGRAAGGFVLTPWLSADTKLKISREHLVLELAGDRLVFTDSSRNGTMVVNAGGVRRRVHRASAPFGYKSRIELAPGLELIRSGRRYPSELQLDRAVATAAEPPPEPTVSY